MSQRQLAQKVPPDGISNTSVHLLVSGEMEPTLEMIEGIASVLLLEPAHFAEYRLERVRHDLNWRGNNLKRALAEARKMGLEP